MEEGWRDRRQEAGPGGCVVVGGGARRGAEAGASWCRAPAARGSGRLSSAQRAGGRGGWGVTGRAHVFRRSAAFWPRAGLGEGSPEERVS